MRRIYRNCIYLFLNSSIRSFATRPLLRNAKHLLMKCIGFECALVEERVVITNNATASLSWNGQISEEIQTEYFETSNKISVA